MVQCPTSLYNQPTIHLGCKEYLWNSAIFIRAACDSSSSAIEASSLQELIDEFDIVGVLG